MGAHTDPSVGNEEQVSDSDIDCCNGESTKTYPSVNFGLLDEEYRYGCTGARWADGSPSEEYCAGKMCSGDSCRYYKKCCVMGGMGGPNTRWCMPKMEFGAQLSCLGR